MENLKDTKARAQIRTRLNRLRLGNFGNCNSVGEKIFELKIYFGPGYRVYFGQEENKIIVILSGGDKSSQAKDIKTAKAYWDEHRRKK